MANTPVSPKVTAQTLTGLGLALIIGAINAVTPELFDFMGAWGAVAYAAVVAGGGFLAGYAVRDPLRVPDADATPPPEGWTPQH